MRRVRAAGAAAAALVEKGCVDHFGPRARGDERFSPCAQVFVRRAGRGDAPIAQRSEPGPRADSVGASGVWLCTSSSSLFPPFPPFPPSFPLLHTNPSSLFQIISLALGMLGCKYVHI
ncbi:hypothetical protein B0H13DRAFT_2332614 [Mycena leptocephala]|nr:hypothetical protein B0H13DRAFT_2332614 [Mycena leptocephala]